MSREYTTTATLTIGDHELDVPVRAHVDAGYGLGMGGAYAAELDGGVDVLVDGVWLPIADLDLDARDVERLEEALCDLAMSDDGSVDADEYDARCCA